MKCNIIHCKNEAQNFGEFGGISLNYCSSHKRFAVKLVNYFRLIKKNYKAYPTKNSKINLKLPKDSRGRKKARGDNINHFVFDDNYG